MNKKIISIIFIFYAIIAFSYNPSHILYLTDGSVIKCELLSFKNSTYKIYSPIIGQIIIKDKFVKSVTSNKNDNSNNNSQSIKPVQNKTGVSAKQLNSIQQNILKKMDASTIQSLMSSPALQNILSDPDIMNDINSGNYTKLLTNPEIIKLMDDPAIKRLLKDIR